MTEKQIQKAAAAQDVPKKQLLVRLVIDQARIDDNVLNHKYEGSGTTEDPYVVTWIDDDAGNPMNWSKRLRWVITMIVASQCFATAFASSAFSGPMRELLFHFRVSSELMTAGISLFVLGFAVGPLIWAPLSEIYGRQYIFFITFAAFTAFSAACTIDNGVTTLLVLRFFGGSFGSSPFTNAGGVIADMFPANERGLAMALFSLAPSMGPTLGPFIGGFLGESEGWQWVMGLISIFVGVMWILGSIFVPETYAPVLLRKRAAKLSKQTGKVYKTKTDIEHGEIPATTVLKTALIRPWILLFMEPIVLVLSIYMAIVYGTLYMLFGAFPIVFQLSRHWSEGVGGLAFLGVAVGMISAVGFCGFANKWYMKTAAKNGGFAPPEARMLPAMIGSIFIPIGLFWFAWGGADNNNIYWMSPVAAGVPFGFGLTLIFLGVTTYLIDAYTIFAASVLAANTVLRSLFGAAFPLFTKDMYSALGNAWGSSVPAFLALVCVPAPFILYKFGAAIRRRCTYAAEAEEAMQALRTKAEPSQYSVSDEESQSDASSTLDRLSTNATEEKVAHFAPIATQKSRSRLFSEAKCPQKLLRTTSRAESLAGATHYEASPWDIDRVNTHTSIRGLKRMRTEKSRG